MGVFNSVLQPSLDRLKPLISESKLFSKWCEAYGYVDIWRWKFPTVKVFSCQSKSYGSLSRLDYALTTKDLLPLVQAITYVAQTISDHSLIQVTLTLGHRPAFRVWRLSPFWISTPGIQESIPTAMANYWASNSDTAATGPVWDAFKAVLQGSYISLIKHCRLTGMALQAALFL